MDIQSGMILELFDVCKNYGGGTTQSWRDYWELNILILSKVDLYPPSQPIAEYIPKVFKPINNLWHIIRSS